MKKIRNWFIGAHLIKLENVFERAKAELLFNFVFFYSIAVVAFYGNVVSHHYYYHAGILTLHLVILLSILFILKYTGNYKLCAKILFFDQIVVGIVSYLIQESSMDYVGEFFIVVNLLVSFFLLGKTYGFIMTAIWMLQIIHCLANELSGGKYILIQIPKDQVLPAAPVSLFIPFSLCVYIIYQFVKTRTIAENDIQLQKKEIEYKNKDITDSITYARRIQHTLLASDGLLKKGLKEYFIFFRPKDIVSGDFYWATEKDGRFYLAVCDSTGHGVPGAFMSLLNISFLNEAIAEKGIQKPNEVFNHVRQRLIENISSDGAKDGMDGILICFDKNKNEISYSAANNSPVVMSASLQELHCDKMPVGLGDRKDSFSHQVISFSQGNILYLYTDGFADQFGGPKGKKFKYKQLNEKLATIGHQPLAEQKKELEKTFDAWKGNLEQVDDVLILGIKI